ncbi:carboxypeptidase regulatory-like domain-containing protein [Nostoc sp. UCD121]|uniref:carboxypeptidase-like regulatory domain-containing protein n=1 Tax=unclassified Nostoc TaxID=2593658 RepID=UPI0016287C2B|nr:MULTISPECIES: carboxypeptidase-like regulatory domain-containing protein [unclassified Nostoc]MBC1220013.1 carboxypeptidase regulatory-like domain-containing protein [Nostoc sp. UCD120]MBC1277355.1 carboxypeptidase regulatory-like domain-containing protein [Nostoc sp. UCD121]
MQLRLLTSRGKFLLAAIALICQIIITPAKADTPASNLQTPTSTQLAKDSEFKVFPVGLNVGNRNVNSSVLVRGQEDGSQAIDFSNWLLPYDAIVQGLKLNVTTLPDGQLEVRSLSVVTRINPTKLRTDPELGLVFTIQDLQTLFGVGAKFDINEYAIILDVPGVDQSSGKLAETETPIQLEGLPHITPKKFSVAAVEQKVNASGGATRSTSYRGDFLAVGSAFGGSWFIRTDQPNLQNPQNWNIAEAQFLRQANSADYFVGSQPTFWQTQGTGDYWGFTSIQRQGFVPPQPFGGGSSDPRQRLQANAIGRTISGKAEPGTLVRLVQGFSDRIIAEILVDSSGIYRFENIKSQNQFLANNYRVLLYPQGRLTAQPEIQQANFSTVPGQLPAGASGLIVSGGLRRDSLGNQSLLGNFSGFRGGIAGRWGLSENLTVGLGGVYDESPKALAELFWRARNLPLQVSVSALTGNKWDVNTDIRYDPASNLSAIFTSDRLSSRFNLDWRVLPQFALFASSDTGDATSSGMQFNLSGKDAFTFARISLDTKNRLRWNLLQRLGKLELTQRGNEISTLSELNYNLSKNRFSNSGNSLLLNYETQNQNRSDSLLSVSWRYRSQQQAIDGSYQWEAQLGYGVGSQGNGILATLSTTVLPGLLLRARYQGVSPSSDEATFSIDLASSLNLQGGISPGDRRSNYFRTQGGLSIKPFFDRNNNGKWDGGEEVYTDNADLLLTLNNKPLKSFLPQIQGDRTLVRMPPGIYRLDLDPAGLPPDWQPMVESVAIDVVAGSYTPVMIPLIRSYARSGVVTDTQGQAIAGARVEAIQPDQTTRCFSVTNGAGVYYLEGLSQGKYTLQINGKSAGTLKLEESSEAFQELNLQQP